MVIHVRQLTLLLLTLLFTVSVATAEDRLEVHVDRTQLHENQTLTMTVTGEMPFSMDLDMLFNLGEMELPSPEESALEENFEVLGKHQKYSLRSVNGDARAIITWIYELAPKKTGTLEIPPLTFRDAQSEPVTVEVLAGQAPAADGGAPMALVEVETDKPEVYVQEQLVLMVRLFYRGNLIRGDLSQPSHPDAIVESMGEQQEYVRVRNNTRYRVVERRYVIYPQNPGTLEIDSITFNGQARTDDGQLNFLRDQADPVSVPVKDVPDGFTGKTWLPAASLELSEAWSDRSTDLQAGKSITRTLQLNALGLLGSALPPLDVDYPDAVRSYPDKPEMESSVDRRTVTSSRTESTALVAVQPGEITLPEIRVPWWDTVNDRQRVATLPARTLNITDSNAAAATPPAQTQSHQPEQPQVTTSETSSGSPAKRPETAAPMDRTWLWLAVALGTGWALTVLFWWLNRRRARDPEESAGALDPTEAVLFADLESTIRARSAQTLSLLPRWARRRFNNQHLRSVADVIRFSDDGELEEELNGLQARLYGEHGNDQNWSPDKLIERLQALRERKETLRRSNLAPLYPNGLRSRDARV
ncbi:BatD family protein [Marinobacter nanhaiticus D15-8W]|uniref:Protein BatD n=1 Tax=Marinobacter nanhaiticus D15-8W TaxID=626887 RepID=N6WZS6_9GAMM|nr:BatD family protein [Marinobacter nanhaiticus]ENO17071.1 protein BatD [Marinobacter nanhaiticus D15-8W]BES71933.1 BatD family protein [Marinobacter nanhaiticus D15-8W]